jgi:hypothetical protein
VPSTLTARTGRLLSAADPTGQQAARPCPPADHDIGGPPGGHPEIPAAECNGEVPVADAGRSGHLD